MKAVGIYVLIKPNKSTVRKTKVGIEIPTETTDRFLQGEIKSVSSIGEKEFGLKNGMIVLYDKQSGHDVRGIDGIDYRLVRCQDISVVFED